MNQQQFFPLSGWAMLRRLDMFMFPLKIRLYCIWSSRGNWYSGTYYICKLFLNEYSYRLLTIARSVPIPGVLLLLFLHYFTVVVDSSFRCKRSLRMSGPELNVCRPIEAAKKTLNSSGESTYPRRGPYLTSNHSVHYPLLTPDHAN